MPLSGWKKTSLATPPEPPTALTENGTIMNLVYAIILLAAAATLALAAFTRVGVFFIERNYPADGRFVTVNDTRVHFHHLPAGDDKPTIVFIHGASSNLHDQMTIYRPLLEGQYNLLFFDRPGHGYSSIGPDSNATPKGQAETLAALMDHLGIAQAIIVGHSFGGAVASSFALFHPGKTAGQLLMSPVSHPWPGGVNWYYTLMDIPLLGRLFAETVALPAGLTRLGSGAACVFAPNQPEPDYAEATNVPLILRPGHFRHNGRQVAKLFDYVTAVEPRYKEIAAPTVILTGNRDTIVLPEIHSVGLARDIEDAELYWIDNLGHKSDHVATDFVLAALQKLSGDDSVDLVSTARQLEARLAGDNYGPVDKCLDSEVILKAVNTPDAQRLKGVAPAYD